jgi:preprotein translocase subunit SecA
VRGLISKILGDVNRRELKKINHLVAEINALEERMQTLNAAEMKNLATEFRRRLEGDLSAPRRELAQVKERRSSAVDAGERGYLAEEVKDAEARLLAAERQALWAILPEAFAAVREAAWRTLKMRHFDVQLLGGIVLHQGRIAEMKTGEGKTLVATLPAYLNALLGRGVHIVTVNDYLAGRDRDWMAPVYGYLGLTVGLIVHGLSPAQRREAYGADITYGTNNEFGFDYLRDNMVLYREDLVQRELNYVIVDEVDSILVDEARTPLIISGQADRDETDYRRYSELARRLKKNTDYEVDEKAHTVDLTEAGQHRVEELLGIRNLYGNEEAAGASEDDDAAETGRDGAAVEAAEKNRQVRTLVLQALKAQSLMQRDRDYVVSDKGEIIIVDEFTGRLMYGRRYSEGLHQMIEAKENVKVAKESKTLATITFQNYFRMYRKIAGMTGTARTEEEEFQEIYGIDVVEIPTNKPMIREDLPDVIYKTERGKYRALVEDIVQRHAGGQPLLVGTISIEKSEELSRLLQKRGVRHQVLNAKHHEREADIIAQAGRKGAVTIATNMAGRGTDILLGGNPVVLAEEEFRSRQIETPGQDGAAAAVVENGEQPEKLVSRFEGLTRQEKAEVLALGGLHIMGTERHEARRIDNQLRGRSGRQGDPGSSQFYISLEDDLMRLFGSDNIKGIMEKLGLDEDTPIDHPLISRAIETAQKRVEARNFDIRKHILEYDNVINEQRELIYSQRRRVVEGENLRGQVLDMIGELVDEALVRYAGEKTYEEEWDLKGLLKSAENIFLPPGKLSRYDLKGKDREELRGLLLDTSLSYYAEREKGLGGETMRELERVILLRAVDTRWMDHIDAMDDLRQGIGLRAYAQRNPLVEYKYEAYDMFQDMIRSIREDVIRLLYRVQVVTPPRRQAVAVANETPPGDGTAVHGPARSAKVGRNAPCPCGSGKKHKKCCGKQV